MKTAFFWLVLFAPLYGLAQHNTGVPPAERCRIILKSGTRYLDSARFAAGYAVLSEQAVRENDRKLQWLLEYHRFRNRNALKLSQDEIFQLLSHLEQTATTEQWPVEAVVARHYLGFEQYTSRRIGHEPLFAALLEEFEQMKALGLENFYDYDLPDLMFHAAEFMFDLEDFDYALEFLQAGEAAFGPGKARHRTIVLTLNHLQSVCQKKADYPRAIIYAQKILRVVDTIATDDPAEREFCRFWRGMATIGIASTMMRQRKFAEAEAYADRGYALAKTPETGNTELLEAEFDALMPLISIKLELGKTAEAKQLTDRAEHLWQRIGHKDFNYFKPIRFWRAKAKLSEIDGDFAAAMRYAHLAEVRQDSLDRLTDARKLEKIRQRVAAMNYAEALRGVERDKQRQIRLRNTLAGVLALVILCAALVYRRLQRKKKQTLSDLANTRKELQTYLRGIREKSELAETSSREVGEAAARGEQNRQLQILLQSTILTDEDWIRFRAHFEKVFPGFIREQKSLYPDLTQAELRYLVLEKLQLGTREMARMLGVSDGSIRQTRSRLRKKQM